MERAEKQWFNMSKKGLDFQKHRPTEEDFVLGIMGKA